MFAATSSRLTRIALTASGIAIATAFPSWAQGVRVFDEAPPIEVLRGIMVPESVPGASRSIVIQQPGAGPSAAPTQRMATDAPTTEAPATETPSAETPAAEAPSAEAPDRAAPESASEPAVRRPIKPAARERPRAVARAGTVGFRINFAFNSTSLPDSSHAMIDTVAQVMKETPSIRVRVEGHTDAIGSADYNNVLSERRARAVGVYLVEHGIDPARIELIGKGMSEPLVKNPYDPQNRRVQFVRIG